MTHDELAETVAKAIYAVTYKGRADPWHNAIARRARTGSPDTPTVRQARKYANAAIAAVYTVLREATPEIIKAALNADAIPAENSDEFLALDENERDRAWWRGQIAAMLDASPLAPKEGDAP